MVPEALTDLSAFKLSSASPKPVSLSSLAASYTAEETYGEPTTPLLLRKIMASDLDDSGSGEPSLMEDIRRSSTMELSCLDVHGHSALHIAAARGANGLVKILLERLRDVGVKDNSGRTPLMHASLNNQESTVEILLECNADVTAKDHRGDSALHLAASSGSFDALRYLLRQFPRSEIDSFGAVGQAPMHLACKLKTPDMIRLLLEAGADYNLPDSEGATPLHIASQLGRAELVSFLLDAGAEPNVVTDYMEAAAIHMAAKAGSVDCVRQLIDGGSQLSFPGMASPLFTACRRGHLEVVRLLVSCGAEIADEDGSDALSVACAEGFEDVVDFLLSLPCYAVGPGGSARSLVRPLLAAAERGRLSIVRRLVDSGAVRLDASEGEDGVQAVHAAAKGGSLEVLKFLLSRGASVETVSARGDTPLTLSAANGHAACLQCLMDTATSSYTKLWSGKALREAARNGYLLAVLLVLRADLSCIDSADENGATALHLAAGGGHSHIFQALLNKGAECQLQLRASQANTLLHLTVLGGNIKILKHILDFLLLGLLSPTQRLEFPNSKNQNGATALILAAEAGNTAFVEELLQHGADPALTDEELRSPLHHAAATGSAEVIKLLLAISSERAVLDRDNELNQKDDRGATPLMCGAEHGHHEVVKILLEAGGSLETLDKTGQGVLSLAAKSGRLETFELLRSAGAAVAQADKLGRTCLHVAAGNGSTAIVGDLLTSKRIDPDVADNDGTTPLHLAIRNGNVGVMRVLFSFGADASKAANDGSTGFSLAQNSGSAEIVRLYADYCERRMFGSVKQRVVGWVSDLDASSAENADHSGISDTSDDGFLSRLAQDCFEPSLPESFIERHFGQTGETDAAELAAADSSMGSFLSTVGSSTRSRNRAER